MLTPIEATQFWIDSSVKRVSARIDVLFIKAFWGGIFLSYGGALEAVVGGSTSVATNNVGLLRLVEGLVFPVGIVMIVFTGTELLTANMITLVMAAMKGRVPWWSVLANWIVVFLGNLCGSLFFATIFIHYTGLASSNSATYLPAREFLVAAATLKVIELSFLELFLRAIGCNILVGACVFFAVQAEDMTGKILGMFIPIAVFAAIGFEHVVADMFGVPCGIILGSPATVGEYIGKTMVAAFLGNVVGGVALGLSLYFIHIYPDECLAQLEDSDSGSTNVSDKLLYHREMDSPYWSQGLFGSNTFWSPFGETKSKGLKKVKELLD